MNDEWIKRICLVSIPFCALAGIVIGLWVSNSIYGLALGMFLSTIFNIPFMFKYSKKVELR